MIIQRMHHEIKLRFNKLNSNHKADLTPAMIDDLINDAQHSYIEMFYSGNNLKKYKLGFEVTQQRIDMLSNLVEKPTTPLTSPLIHNNRYEFSLDIAPKYKHLVRAYAKTNCGLVNVTPIRHNDLNTILTDVQRGPSKLWRRLICATGTSTVDPENSSLYVYSEPGFIVDEVFIEYIREPRKVFFGGYDTLEYIHGDTDAPMNTDNPINSELADQYHTVLVDIVVQELSRILEDVNRFQLRQEKILSTT
jgi:hypothetical protein